MAAAIRVLLGQTAHKYVLSIIASPRCYKLNDKRFFHNTYYLCVAGQEIKMPSLSPTMSEGTIVKWLKKEGDKIEPGDVLCDIQTDKAVVSFETEEEGVLAKIIVPDNTSDVKVGTLIGLMVREGEDWKSVEMPASAGATPASPSTPASTSTPVESKPPTPESKHKEKKTQLLGPAVRLMLDRYGLDASKLVGSGPKGIIIKQDVVNFVEKNKLSAVSPKEVPAPTAAAKPKAKSAAPAAGKAGGEYTDRELTGMRRTIAKRLLESKSTIPHAYGSTQCVVDKLLKLKKNLKKDEIAVSVNDFVLKSVANALVQYPEVNVHWIKEQIIPLPSVDISVAVATDAGLITPIIKDAPAKGLIAISAEMKALAEKARKGKLQPHEYQGGSFTVSNLGMYGIKSFSAIINPPQCAILAVGGGQPALGPDVSPVTKLTITLSYDERAIDEITAAKFLQAVSNGLADPELLLLGWSKEPVKEGCGCKG